MSENLEDLKPFELVANEPFEYDDLIYDKQVTPFNMEELVDKINQNDITGAHEYLSQKILKDKNLTTNDVQTAINYGLNPRYGNDLFLANSCYRGDIEMVKLLIEQYGCDIVASGKFLLNAFLGSKDKHVIKYLIENGTKITDDDIKLVFLCGPSYLDLLAENGVPHEKMFELFFSRKARSFQVLDRTYEMFKYFADTDLNLNELIKKMD